MPRLIINDSNFHLHIQPPVINGVQMRAGLSLPRSAVHLVGTPYRGKIYPRSDWRGMIEERKAKGLMVSDLMRRMGIPSLNQGSTNYCWFNGVVTAIYGNRALQNLPYVALSPASGAAPIKGFRNIGGWGDEALQWIVANGVNSQAEWPANAIDRRYYTEENKAKARERRVTEFEILQPRNLDEKVSALLDFKLVACGYNWWAHEVCAVDPDWVDGQIATIERNSWGDDYGEDGFFTLQGKKMLADDAVIPLVADAFQS